MEETIKNEVKKIMEIKGEGRGVIFRCIADYVREKKGEEGIKRLEKEMENLGYPLEFAKAKNLEWYPVGLRVLALISAKRAFNWENEEIRKMGDAAPKFSFLVKLVMNYFASPRGVFDLASKHWKKHYSIGNLESVEWHEKEKHKRCILRLKDFKVHPILCIFLRGYFERMAQLGGGKNVTCEETKCMHKGDLYHEFLFTWE